jgi:hypothetical protein
MEISLVTIIAIITGLLSAGAVWGSLTMRSRANTTRIEEVKSEHDKDIEDIKAAVQSLALAQESHRMENTDRLARIETKLDSLISE